MVFVVCNHCDKLRVGDCPVHGGLRWIKEPTAVMERDGLTRARSTIPSSMDLKISSIPGELFFPAVIFHLLKKTEMMKATGHVYEFNKKGLLMLGKICVQTVLLACQILNYIDRFFLSQLVVCSVYVFLW